MRIEQRVRQPGELRCWLACVGAVLLIVGGLAWLHGCGVSVCLFRRLTGWPCLTCGATRAFSALLTGHLADAFKLQPLAVVAGVLAGAACGAQAWFLLVRRRVVRVRLEPAERQVFWTAVIVLAVLNWLYLVRCGV
jgi:hypothetical protein